MAHQNRYTFKRNGKWVDADGLSERKSAESEMPHINLAFLPSVEELNKLEEGEIMEYYYLCESWIPVVIEGVAVRKRKCGAKFGSQVIAEYCPTCSGENLKEIPRAFLRLYGTYSEVRRYVTDEMKVRGGLKKESASIARQIIEVYGRTKQIETLKKEGT